MRNSWKRLLAICCGVCMSVFAGFALSSCKDPEDESSSSVESSVDSTVEAHVHAWDNGVVASTSTCAKQGETVFTCTTCGEKKVEYAPLGQHSYAETEAVAPTCTEKGYTVSTCSVCFDEIRSNYTDATGHDYERTTTLKTCTADSIATYDCKHCDYYYTEIAERATGHNTQDATWTVASATLVSGSTCMYTLTEAATCQEAGCGATVTRVAAEPVHRPNYSHEVTTPATCTTEGVITYTCACGEYSYTQTIGYGLHAWDDGETVGNVTTFTCLHNNQHTKQTVSAQKVDDTSSKLSTEALAGTTAAEVAVTDNTKMQMDADLLGALTSGAAQDVTFVAEELTGDNIPDTVDKSRLKEGATVYNFDLKDAEGNPLFGEGSTGSMTITVPYPLEDGEDPSSIRVLWLKDNGEVVSSPAIYSAANGGTATFTVNHFSYYTVVRMTPEERCERDGHKDVTITVPNDCTHGGYTLTVCGVCGKEERTNITNPTGHNYVPTVVAPTCQEMGRTVYTCSHEGCGDVYTSNLVAMVAHVYTDSVVAPTCTDKGYTKHTCTGCGKSYSDTYTAAAGHSFADGVCSVCGEDAPESYLRADNFYFNLIESISKQDRFYLEAEDISFTADVTMDGMENVAVAEVEMYRFAFKLDKDGYIVGQGEGKVRASLTETENGKTDSAEYEIDMIVIFQNGKIYMLQKRAESVNGQTNRETLYMMTPQDEANLDDMKVMYEQVFGDSISNILKGMMAQENNPVNTVMATVMEYVFTKTETTEGYSFTVNYDALPGIYDGLTEMTVAEVYDAVFGEGAYLRAYNYAYALPEKTVEQVRNDIVAWCMERGVDIKDVYAALDAVLNNMPTGGMGGNVQDEPMQGGGVVQPTNSTEEPAPISVEEIITEYREYTIAQLLDMMNEVPEGETGLEMYKGMIAQIGDPTEGMLAQASIADIAMGSAMGNFEDEEEAEAMMQMITSLMSFIDEQLTGLATALEGTSSIGFTTDKEGNINTLGFAFDEVEYELTVDGNIVAMLSGGDMDCDVEISLTANGTATVTMGGTYIAEYDHIVAGLEKSLSVFDITETIELTKQEYYYLDKEQNIKVYYDRGYVLVPTEEGIIYTLAYGTNYEHSNPYETRDDIYQGQECTSYKIDIWGSSSYLLVPEKGVSYADSCSGWRRYESSAFYCDGGATYKVYKVGTTVLGLELCVEDMLESVEKGSHSTTVEFYYNAGLNKYSLNDPHNWILTKTVLPVECEDKGYHAYRCSVCGGEYVETLYKSHDVEHSYVLLTPGTTCEDGIKEIYKCRVCDKVVQERVESESYAGMHPTYEVREELPNKTAGCCEEHYLSYYQCACGRKGNANVSHYDGEGNFSRIATVWVEGEGDHYYEIYRCAVKGCGYTYARETKRTYDTENCTVTETAHLYAGIVYNDAQNTITSYGKKYEYSTTDSWHPSAYGRTVEEGNIVTEIHVCQNCGKDIYYNKYEKFYYTDQDGMTDWASRSIAWFNYEDEYGYRYEYDDHCNATYYNLYMKDGVIVESDGRSDGTRHTEVGVTIKEATCSQFAEYRYDCVACNNSSRTVYAPYETGHNLNPEAGVGYVCSDCGVVIESGSSGVFVLEDMVANGEVKVGYMNKYNRDYNIRIFVNYGMEDEYEITDNSLYINQVTNRMDEYEYNDYWWGYAQCGIVTLDMDAILEVIGNYNLNAKLLSVVFATYHNVEMEGEGSTEYALHLEIGKAGTYKLSSYNLYNTPSTEYTADDFVITLNADFTYTITTNNGIEAFSNSGYWKTFGNKICLYGPNGEYDELNADMCLFNEYGYWYFELEEVCTYVIDTTAHTDMNAEDLVITLYSNNTYTMTVDGEVYLFSADGRWKEVDNKIYLYNVDGNCATLSEILVFQNPGAAAIYQMTLAE